MPSELSAARVARQTYHQALLPRNLPTNCCVWLRRTWTRLGGDAILCGVFFGLLSPRRHGRSSATAPTATISPANAASPSPTRSCNNGKADLVRAELVISERTARTHVSNILRKLDLASRTQAALWAVREGLGEADTTT